MGTEKSAEELHAEYGFKPDEVVVVKQDSEETWWVVVRQVGEVVYLEDFYGRRIRRKSVHLTQVTIETRAGLVGLKDLVRHYILNHRLDHVPLEYIREHRAACETHLQVCLGPCVNEPSIQLAFLASS